MQQLTSSFQLATPSQFNDWMFIVVDREWLWRAMSTDGMTVEFWDDDKDEHCMLVRHPKSRTDHRKTGGHSFMIYWKSDKKFFINPVYFAEK